MSRALHIGVAVLEIRLSEMGASQAPTPGGEKSERGNVLPLSGTGSCFVVVLGPRTLSFCLPRWAPV